MVTNEFIESREMLKPVIEKKFEAAKENKNLKDPPPTVLWD